MQAPVLLRCTNVNDLVDVQACKVMYFVRSAIFDALVAFSMQSRYFKWASKMRFLQTIEVVTLFNKSEIRKSLNIEPLPLRNKRFC